MSSNVFGNLSDDDENDNNQQHQYSKNNHRSFINSQLSNYNQISKRQMINQASKNIMDDPMLYSYDDFVEENHQKRHEIKQEKKKNIETPKYLQNIISATDKRKREQEIIYEKLQKKKIQKDHDQFGDKEEFITGTYLKKLEENKTFQKEDEMKEEYNKLHTVENKTNMNDFYKNIYQDNAFRGGKRENIEKVSKQIQQQKQFQNQQQKQSNSNDQNKRLSADEQEQLLTKKQIHIPDNQQTEIEKNKEEIKNKQKKVSKSRSRSRSKEKKQTQKEQEKSEDKEKEKEQQYKAPQITAQNKVLNARERYLQRKQQEQENAKKIQEQEELQNNNNSNQNQNKQ